jgi:hypothetical protein
MFLTDRYGGHKQKWQIVCACTASTRRHSVSLVTTIITGQECGRIGGGGARLQLCDLCSVFEKNENQV